MTEKHNWRAECACGCCNVKFSLDTRPLPIHIPVEREGVVP